MYLYAGQTLMSRTSLKIQLHVFQLGLLMLLKNALLLPYIHVGGIDSMGRVPTKKNIRGGRE